MSRLRNAHDDSALQATGLPGLDGHGASRHVVIYIEDNPVNADLMDAVIGALRPDVQLLVFPDGASGIAGALAQPPDLFLLDLNLPDVDGIVLLTQMRRHASLHHAPAILVSAGASPDDVARARANGFRGFWSKPINVECVMSELAEVLGPPGVATLRG